MTPKPAANKPAISVEPVLASIPTLTEAQRKQLRAQCERHAGGARAADAARILAALDAFEGRTEREEVERRFNAPLAEKVRRAFEDQPATPGEAKAIQALLDRPGATSAQLDAVAKWQGGWHMHFGKLCKKRQAWIAPPPGSDIRRTLAGEAASFWCGILAVYDDETAGFTMKPEAAEAFSALGFR